MKMYRCRVVSIVLLIPLVACTDRRPPSISDKWPARISVGTSDTVVVNDTEPVRLAVHVLNAERQVLRASGLQYEFVSGDRIGISRDGRVACEQPGDAVARVSLGELSTLFQILCRPVRELVVGTTVYLVVGDSARELPVGALGLDGQPITPIVAHATMRDTTVATLDGLRVRARAPGGTAAEVRVAGDSVGIGVWVYERARNLDGLGENLRTVAVPVRLAIGSTLRLHIPNGVYLLSVLPDRRSQTRTELKLAAIRANCTKAASRGEQSYGCIVYSGNASVTLENPSRGNPASEFTGELAVFRF